MSSIASITRLNDSLEPKDRQILRLLVDDAETTAMILEMLADPRIRTVSGWTQHTLSYEGLLERLHHLVSLGCVKSYEHSIDVRETTGSTEHATDKTTVTWWSLTPLGRELGVSDVPE